jgi:hypothetical protein
MTFIYNDARYDSITRRLNRVEKYIVDRVERLISLDEAGFEKGARHNYLRLKRANKVKGKLFNKQQLIKYGKA